MHKTITIRQKEGVLKYKLNNYNLWYKWEKNVVRKGFKIQKLSISHLNGR